MNPFLGVFFHGLGGFAAGSFYIPFHQVKNWPWEVFWLVGGFVAWILVPIIVSLITIPDFFSVLQMIPSGFFFWPYFFGFLWGIGGLTFGLTMRYLGMSLGMSLALGLTAVFGTLIPPLFNGQLIEVILTSSGQITLLGIFIGILGIGVVGQAGFLKDRQLDSVKKKETIKEFNFKKGFVVAIISGSLSACFAFGIASGKPLVNAVADHIINPLFVNSLLFTVIMAGGFTTNLLYCGWMIHHNKSLKGIHLSASSQGLKNTFFCALAGTTWYCQFLFYGMGTTQMGRYDFVSWSLHMSFIIIFSNAWGILLKEWKSVRPRIMNVMIMGIMVLLISTIVIGYGNAISEGSIVTKTGDYLKNRWDQINPGIVFQD